MTTPAPSSPVAEKKIKYYSLLRDVEILATEIYPDESLALAVLRKNHEPVRFFDGFASCRAWGKTLYFPTPAQRWICEVLWNPWQGSKEIAVKIDTQTILERAGLSMSGQIEKYFKNQKTKKMNDAIGYLIHFENGVAWMGPPLPQNTPEPKSKSRMKRGSKRR